MVTMQPERYEMKTEEMTFFYCYNPKLRKFLGLSNLRWEKRGINENTGRTYWTFKHSDKLNELIQQYKKENSFAR